MQRVLVLSPMFPSFRHQGNSSRLAAMMEYFRDRDFEIHLAVLCRRPWKTFKPADYHRFADEVHFLDSVGRTCGAEPTPMLTHLCRPASGLGKLLRPWRKPQPTLAREVSELTRRIAPSVVWTNYVHLAPLLAEMPPQAERLRVIDTHDVVHMRHASLTAAGLHDERPMTRQQEAAWLAEADAIVAIQAEECAVLREMLPEHPVLEVARALEIRPLRNHRGSVAFVASNYSANVQGLELFLQHAWPEICRTCPGAKLEIIGTIGENRTIRRYAGSDSSLVIRGVAPALTDVYDGPAVMVCPLWAGSGLKQKVVEALGYGKAMVASPVAAQGLDDGADRAFLMATEPADFIEPVVRLLRSNSQRAACEAAALHYARQKFSADVVYAELDALLSGATHKQLALADAA